ncbi:sugar kinase [Aquibacillus sp. 3ASR75-11]|uniref:Sugar kinase n=1 Tax=Terrihalobacillus insolitus TaxID=2950438 RepID=A0A9X3WNG0_9BACI|nr:sugar kinase [Terrihalobacillus insolitus]MDC3412055.1 sugar kinase [Terrihalobacillus insolitus]MDC3423252.1 sugar kinase [Terrihalobacillus insolitus]
MNDVVTIGDAMITFDPSSTGPMRFVDSFTRKVGGAEFNVAIGCARLGLKTGWITRLGQDEFGRFIYNFARGEGIDISEVELIEDFPTSINFKEIHADGSSKTFYYRQKSPTLKLTAESLEENFFEQARLLHVTGVFPAVNDQNIETVDRAIQLAKKHNVKISLDPNIRLKLWSEEKAKTTLLRWMRHVDYLLTGMEEAELLFGTTDLNEVIDLAKKYSISHLFIKKGEEGATLWTNSHLYNEPARENVKAVDTVGAGDGFDVGAIYGLLQDWSPEKILKFANVIGSMVVEVVGDNEGLPYLSEALNKLEDKKIVER